jgi:hypothetical protein
MDILDFRNLDFVSTGPYFMIQNKYREKSFYGASLSLMVIACLVFFCWTMGNDIIYQQNPNVVVGFESLKYYPKLNFSKTNYFFGFRLEDLLGVPIPLDDTIATFSMIHGIQKLKDPNTTKLEISGNKTFSDQVEIKTEDIPLSHCEFLFNYFPSYMSEGDLKTLYCPREDYYNFSLYGYWVVADFSYLTIYLSKCKNSTDSNIKCRPEEEIDKIIDGAYFNMYISDSIFLPRNVSDPIRSVMKNVYQLVHVNQYKDVELRLQTMDVHTDLGWLFPQTIKRNSSMFSEISVDSTFNENEKEDLMSVWVYNTNKVNLFERDYIKIQNLLAGVGGIAKILLLVAYAINYNYNLKKINLKLMSEIFNFKHTYDRKSKTLINLNRNSKRSSGIRIDSCEVNSSQDSRSNHMSKNSCPSNRNVEISAVKGTFYDTCKSNVSSGEVNEARIVSSGSEQSPITSALKNTEATPVKRKESQTCDVVEIKRKRSLNTLHKTTKLKYSFWQMLDSVYCICFKCLKTKKVKYLDDLYNKSLKTVQVYLNVNLMIKKMQEIEQLKYLLLNKEQLICFKYFDKSHVKLLKNGKVENKTSNYCFETEDDELKQILDHYINDVKRENLENLDHIDYKVFKLLDQNIKSYICDNVYEL